MRISKSKQRNKSRNGLYIAYFRNTLFRDYCILIIMHNNCQHLPHLNSVKHLKCYSMEVRLDLEKRRKDK